MMSPEIVKRIKHAAVEEERALQCARYDRDTDSFVEVALGAASFVFLWGANYGQRQLFRVHVTLNWGETGGNISASSFQVARLMGWATVIPAARQASRRRA